MFFNSSNRRRLILVFLITIVALFITDMCIAESESDNAALLYCQALLAGPDFDIVLVDEVLSGAEPNETVKKYIQSCDEKINLAESASKIPQCNWVILDTQPVYVMNLRDLSRLLVVKAIILASEGKYKAALDKCIAVQRLANHIENFNTIVMHSFSLGIRKISFVCIQRILGSLPPDEEILIWLQAQISMQCRDISLTKAMENERDIAIEYLKKDSEPIEIWKLQAAILLGLPYDEKQANGIDPNIVEDFKEMKKILDLPGGKVQEIFRKLTKSEVDISAEELKKAKEGFSYTDETKKEIKKLLTKSNEELLEHARQSYDQFLYSAIRIIESELPYNHKLNEIKRLDNKIGQDFFDISTIVTEISYSNFVELYRIQVLYQAHLNIMKSAIEIYLVKAKTGKLPEKLPEYLPKDPLCGQDFIYEITREGFTLKSSADMNTRNNMKYEFTVTEK